MYSAVIAKPKRNVFAVLDIGTTKIICLIVKINGNFSYKVTGTGYKIAEGVNGGSITNVKHANYSISSTIGLAEQVSEETIDRSMASLNSLSASS